MPGQASRLPIFGASLPADRRPPINRQFYRAPAAANRLGGHGGPPHYPDLRAAVEGLCERKFGPGGPYHPDTPGPWKDSPKVRAAAQVHDQAFRDCVALQAQYIYDTFGKFPGTVSSIWVIMYLQAHHLDLEFYDTFYKPGSYLRTHEQHLQQWHPELDSP